MHPLEKKTLKTIQQENLLQTGEIVVVGVSGGPDSMALLHVLNRLAPELDITLTAVYVNHGLRPDETATEKNIVETQAHRLGAAFVTGQIDVRGLAAKQRISIAHAARILRYDFLENAAHACNAAKIGLAHTADDQAEEILLRLIRGTGRKGLSGMKTLRAGRFIRPFLRIPKSHLLDYLHTYLIPFHLDSSNTQNIYLRNRIRNDLLPYLEARYNPDIRETLNRTANILQDEEELLENITGEAFAETIITSPGKTATTSGCTLLPDKSELPELQLSLKLFHKHSRAVQRRVLEKCCWLMGCEPRSRQIELLLKIAMPDSSACSLHLADGLRASKNNEMLEFTYPQGRGPFRGKLTTGTGMELPETRIPAPGSYEFPAFHRKLTVEKIDGYRPGSDEIYGLGEYLDAALFSFPLTLRGSRTGDRFHPLGAPGRKKVSDFLSDQKIDKNLRATVPVLCVDDSIIALPGLRIDHRYRITENTIQAVRIQWMEME